MIKDHWDEDENAIGLCESSERFLVYIAVYEDKPNKFYLALESPSLDDSFPYTPAGEFDDLTLEEVEDKTASHLRLDMLNEGTKYK